MASEDEERDKSNLKVLVQNGKISRSTEGFRCEDRGIVGQSKRGWSQGITPGREAPKEPHPRALNMWARLRPRGPGEESTSLYFNPLLGKTLERAQRVSSGEAQTSQDCGESL